ncbi:uncharacterized protein LOC118738212 [Rhagoletis pomonella]|uniref:uncharacterized protein LOC118738212 n=1 Tax=Rhagoletis pomonella TaxID=28610 RepID=UPI0017869AF3|nr:uncharacterized protein LOC118738212 [Rhagoletis pomonella]
MKALYGWLSIFWHTCILAAISAKTVKLGPPIDPEIFTSTTTTTLAPTVASTTNLIAANNNTTSDGDSSAINSTNVYDHNHKILLLILSDLNVRKVGDPQQQGKMLNDSNNGANKISNETLILDEQRFKELLTKFQPTTRKDGTTKCPETSKCVNIVPNFVPPTFPWIIRKEPRKPIVYIEPLVCEDTGKDAQPMMVASASGVSQTRRRKPIDPSRTSIGHARARVLNNARKHQRSGTAANYVLKSKFGARRNTPHSMYPPNYFKNMNYAHSAYESDPWADYSFEDNE